MSPDAPAGRRGGARARKWFALSAGAVLLGLGGALLLPTGDEAPLRPTSLGTVVVPGRDTRVAREPERVARVERPPAVSEAAPSEASGEALSAALNEERVVLTSTAVIEGIDASRPWVCTGEPVRLSARVGGAPEPDAVHRWVWPGLEGGAELHPGTWLQWRAPATAGRYYVRFQVCRDLGGRRVGVLAERLVGIDVRSCDRGEGQEADALRVEVSQRGQGTFVFRAVSAGDAPLSAYTWDFGDGHSAQTAAPVASHAYDTRALGAGDTRGFTVRLRALRGTGAPLVATTSVQVRGQPPPDAPPLASLEVERGETGDEGWRSEVKVHVPEGGDVTWEHVERVTVRWDDQVEVSTRAWRDVITVVEELGRGGFRGYATVRASEVSPDVKQVVDTLRGRDATGQSVALSWASYKREAAPAATGAQDRPPLKYP